MKTLPLLALTLLTQTGNLAAQRESSGTDKIGTKRVVFAQSCFWTGEMKLGQIEGVVRTEAGFFKGREVTLVEYTPTKVTLEELVCQAREAGVATTVYLEAGPQRSVAGVAVGQPLDGTYSAAPLADQKKQIEDTPFAHLQLSPEQATKVNAFARADPAKALEWLTPAQRSGIGQ